MEPLEDDFRRYLPQNENERLMVKLILDRLPAYKDLNRLKSVEIDSLIYLAQYHIDHGLNVKNEEFDTTKGNNNVSPDVVGLFVDPNLTSYHGTHVAGILGAVRNNGIGMDGVADHVQVMMLKVVGNIRELRDRSLAGGLDMQLIMGLKLLT